MIGFSIDHSTVLRSSYRKKISFDQLKYSSHGSHSSLITCFLSFVNKDKKLIKSYI